MIVTLREATQDDWELIMAWRSLPQVYEGKYTQRKALTWKEHYTFMTTRGPWWRYFIIVLEEDGLEELSTPPRKVGVVTLAQLEDFNPQFNSFIGEAALYSPDVEYDAMLLALDWLRERGYCKTHTVIRDSNQRWADLVTSLGLKRVGPARTGESTWEMYLSDTDKSTEYTSGRKSL